MIRRQMRSSWNIQTFLFRLRFVVEMLGAGVSDRLPDQGTDINTYCTISSSDKIDVQVIRSPLLKFFSVRRGMLVDLLNALQAFGSQYSTSSLAVAR